MSNYVTFRIVETRNGEWFLYLHNHSQRLVSEQFRSRNLDEVVTKLKGKISYRRGFCNALLSEMQVIGGYNRRGMKTKPKSQGTTPQTTRKAH
jgi:hypothetical protein